MFSKTKQHQIRNIDGYVFDGSINIQTTVGALKIWQHYYHTHLNNFKIVALIKTMIFKR